MIYALVDIAYYLIARCRRQMLKKTVEVAAIATLVACCAEMKTAALNKLVQH